MGLLGAAAPGHCGTIRGRVQLTGAQPLHHADVYLLRTGRHVETASDGTFEFKDVAPGRYELDAEMKALSAERKVVEVTTGADPAEVVFTLQVAAVRDSITVTASLQETTTADAFQTVTSVSSHELTTKNAVGLGELLDQESGIAKRSFGPGSSRPVVRGFDGDRVLVMQDGVRTGTLSSQSGDHGEAVDATTIDKIEVVRGPATLLYGSNAIGGVVNIISRDQDIDSHPHPGVHGGLSGGAGTTNSYGAGSGNFEFGLGNFAVWASGGGQRSGDYNTPLGRVQNSATELKHTSIGVGRYGERVSASGTYTVQDSLYGIPDAHAGEEEEEEEEEDHHHGPVSIATRRHNGRANLTFKGLGGGLDRMQFIANYSDYRHRELEGDEVATRFLNKQFSYQGLAQQKRRGSYSGSAGFWGMTRDYKATGEEALAPPTSQKAFAVFGLQEMGGEKIHFQFGARYEHNGYKAQGLKQRSFNGLSASGGMRYTTWTGGALLVNFTQSYRAPALEELYNKGPHPGNLTYENGNAGLVGERSQGGDISLRHHSNRFRAEVSAFQYRMSNFVYLQSTGEFEDGLLVADYLQADARYQGAEARMDVAMHQSLWLNLGVDGVHARLTESRDWLPRIPPVRARVGLDVRRGSLSLRPEFQFARRQTHVADHETETAGYGVFNVRLTHTIARQHSLHTLGVAVFNASNRVYRNHLSFIKDAAAEIGAGVRVTYTMNFF